MSTPEEAFESWVGEVGEGVSASEERWGENFVKLAPREYLNTKILEIGETPRAMTDIPDKDGNLMAAKYDPLTKSVWTKLRSRDDASLLVYVSEKPIRIVEKYNLEFFNYEDYQYLGAYLAEKGQARSAGKLFAEAIKSGNADAHINKGVYHFRCGSTGVFENFQLAQKHFDKGLAILAKMGLPPEDERRRRRLCLDAREEIAYRSSGSFGRAIKFIIRLITFRVGHDIFYVGPADRKILNDQRLLQQMTDQSARYETQMLKDATDDFISQMKLDLPLNLPGVAQSLDGLADQVRTAQTDDEIMARAQQIGRLYAYILAARTQHEKVVEESKRQAATSVLDRIAADEQTEMAKLDSRFGLKSPRELSTMAANKDIDRPFAMWLYKERSHFRMIMEVLYRNPYIPDDLKKEIGEKFKFQAKSPGA